MGFKGFWHLEQYRIPGYLGLVQHCPRLLEPASPAKLSFIAVCMAQCGGLRVQSLPDLYGFWETLNPKPLCGTLGFGDKDKDLELRSQSLIDLQPMVFSVFSFWNS